MLNKALLLSFISGYLPRRSARPVNYGRAGGHSLDFSLPGVKCAEQTDPGITQRLDTLAGYLRADSHKGLCGWIGVKGVTSPSVSRGTFFTPLEVRTSRQTSTKRWAKV